MSVPRGIRNNNPGNIRRSGDPWQGLADEQKDPNFLQFTAPAFGIRAMGRLLQAYQERHDRKTIREVIGRWAPPEENQTDSYAEWVAKRMDTAPDEPIDVSHYPTALALTKAITRMENGAPPTGKPAAWYTDDVFERGLRLAGITPSKPLRKSRTTRGAATAASGIAGAVAVLTDTFSVPPDLANLLPVVLANQPQETVAAWALGIGLLGALYSIWTRYDDKRQGRL